MSAVASVMGKIENFSIVRYTDNRPEVPFISEFPVPKTTKQAVVSELVSMIEDPAYHANAAAPQFFYWYDIMLDKTDFKSDGKVDVAKINSLIAVESLDYWLLKNLQKNARDV